jgi:hypothetical protein
MLAISQNSDPAAWGREALEMIRRDYYLPKTKLYSERADKKQPAFNWGVGVMLSAMNAAAKHDRKFKPWLREYADASRVYWNKGGYDVLPVPKPLDRYYDDNAWMALALVETYEVLGDKKYLDWAKGALDFALEGEAKDGGIYWRESDKASRNTCACAPTAVACIVIGRHANNQALIERGRRIYEWAAKHLRDPDDGLYWDALANSGKLDKTKWTYNTALMLRANYELLVEDGHKSAPIETDDSSRRRWLKQGRIDDSARFSHLLLETWVTVSGVRPEYADAVASVYAARNGKGWFPSHWGELKVAENPEILDQASFARACFILATPRRGSRSSSSGSKVAFGP